MDLRIIEERFLESPFQDIGRGRKKAKFDVDNFYETKFKILILIIIFINKKFKPLI